MEDNVKQPKIYTDRKPRLHDTFFFVSYKHLNSNEVFDVLNRLYDEGVNYWYDVDLGKHIGEPWNGPAMDMLDKKECVGAIVFISKDSCLSQACYQEIKKINDLIKNNKNFKLIPIFIGFDFVSNLEITIEKELSEGKIKENQKEATIKEKINELKILMHDDAGLFRIYTKDNYEWLKDIITNIGQAGAIEKNIFHLEDTSFFTKLHGVNGKRHYEVKIGEYHFENENDNRPIEWIAIKQEKNYLYLATKYVVDFVVESDIDNVLKKIKKSIKIENAIEDIGLITIKDMEVLAEQIGKFIPTDYADVNRAQFLRMNYLLNPSTLQYSRCNQNGIIIDKKCDYRNINCGVRLFIKINLDNV